MNVTASQSPVRILAPQVFGRGGWAKTSREAISGDSGAAV
jgi:hypothetical protein